MILCDKLILKEKTALKDVRKSLVNFYQKFFITFNINKVLITNIKLK